MNKRVFIINSKAARKNAADAVMRIKGDDNLEVIIQPHEDDQTAEQRKFWHVLVKIFADEIGDSPESLKMDIKRETFGVDVVVSKVTGRENEIVKSSTKANKNEYSQLIETTYRLAAEFGVVLPNPRWNE